MKKRVKRRRRRRRGKETCKEKEIALSGPKDHKVDKEIPLGFDPKSTADPEIKGKNPKYVQTLKAQDSEPTHKTGGDSQAVVDPLKLTTLSSIGPELETQGDVMPLSEYKLNRSHLPVVNRTLKCRKALVGGIEKFVMEGFEESTLWDISGPDVAQVGVETSTMIARMALAGQLSTKVMVKEIDHPKQYVA